MASLGRQAALVPLNLTDGRKLYETYYSTRSHWMSHSGRLGRGPTAGNAQPSGRRSHAEDGRCWLQFIFQFFRWPISPKRFNATETMTRALLMLLGFTL